MPSPLADSGSSPRECIDGLIWVGDSYPQFLCQTEPTCAPPFRPGPGHCFVHEAEWRGISRKIASIPEWIVPGRSRIFLVHRGGRKSKSSIGGRIYGYFVVGRTEVLVDDPVSPSPPPDGPGPGPGDGPAHRQPRTERCWDGSLITTHEWRDGRWVRTDERCPEIPAPGCRDGQVQKARCPDGSSIVTAVCVDGRWRATGARCRARPPISREKEKPPRECESDSDFPGLRTDPDASYLVDPLDAAVTDAYSALFDDGDGSPPPAPPAVETWQKPLTPEQRLFVKVAEQRRRALADTLVLPASLAEVAYPRGPLVLFKKPPLYDAYPSAVIRHIKHIDGDHLMEQIVAGVDRAHVRSCVKPGKGDSLTQAEIANLLGCELSLSENTVVRFLTSLRDLAEKEIVDCGVFRVPGFGVFRRPRQPGRSITKAEVESRLAGEIGCTRAIVDRLLDHLKVLALQQLAEGHSLRLNGLFTLKPSEKGVGHDLRDRMSKLGVGFNLEL